MEAASYTVARVRVEGMEVIRLYDQGHDTEVLILPSFGNNAYSMKVKGQQIMWSPYRTLAEWKAKPAQAANPFLAPPADLFAVNQPASAVQESVPCRMS